MSKRILALLLAGIIAVSLVACNGKVVNEAASVDPLTKDDVIEVYISSSASWPYKEDWKVWEYIKENVGATVNVTAVPAAETLTKWPVLYASPDLLPDVMTQWRTACPELGADGVAIDINTQLEYMPNFVAWRDGLDDSLYTTFILPNMDTEGRMYSAPITGFETSGQARAWLYRKDIFEKHNLKLPTTFDELYEVCKELKKLYPNSYPFCLRDAIYNMAHLGPAFNKYWEPTLYYDYNEETWKYGALDDTMLEVMEFFKKMIEEGLMPPNTVNIPVSEWQELITSDRGFIFLDYMTRIDNFNSTMSTSGTDFEMSAFEPPIANTEKGVAAVSRQFTATDASIICNTRSDKRIANAAKYMDWFYTDEAEELVSWGKEGETYEVVDGKRKFITDETGAIPKVLYGFCSVGSFCRMDVDAVDTSYSDKLLAVKPMIVETAIDKFNPVTYITLTPEEREKYTDIQTAVWTYQQEMTAKILLGQEPMSKFDEFKETLVELGVEDMIKIYSDAFDRLNESLAKSK